MDHLAVASHRAWDNLIRYGYDLGGRWLGGPDNDMSSDAADAFYFCQVEFEAGNFELEDGGVIYDLKHILANGSADLRL